MRSTPPTTKVASLVSNITHKTYNSSHCFQCFANLLSELSNNKILIIFITQTAHRMKNNVELDQLIEFFIKQLIESNSVLFNQLIGLDDNRMLTQ